jgi:L-threonylcarbamoyladenylate synthase
VTETNELERAVEHLKAGGVVAVAHETYFTLCADARRASAVDAVFALKEREEPGACAVLIPTMDALAPLVREIPAVARRLGDRFWPGPLTIKLPAADDAHQALKLHGRLAARVPGPSPALDLVRAFGGALTATSANPTGSPSSRTDDDVRAYFTGRGGLLVVQGQANGGMPSTVVQIDDNTARIVRAGAIPQSVLDGVLDAATAA